MNVEVTDDDIEVLIEMAGFGIGYWCDHAVVDSEARTYTVHEDGTGKEFTLSYDKIADVLVDIATLNSYDIGYAAESARQFVADRLEGGEASEYAAGAFDADTGDAVIQCACFGELVYG